MSEYHCTACQIPDAPDAVDIAKRIGGIQWWRPRDLGEVCGEAVANAYKAGRCARHASLIGALVELAIREEFARRHLPTIPPPPER